MSLASLSDDDDSGEYAMLCAQLLHYEQEYVNQENHAMVTSVQVQELQEDVADLQGSIGEWQAFQVNVEHSFELLDAERREAHEQHSYLRNELRREQYANEQLHQLIHRLESLGMNESTLPSEEQTLFRKMRHQIDVLTSELWESNNVVTELTVSNEEFGAAVRAPLLRECVQAQSEITTLSEELLAAHTEMQGARNQIVDRTRMHSHEMTTSMMLCRGAYVDTLENHLQVGGSSRAQGCKAVPSSVRTRGTVGWAMEISDGSRSSTDIEMFTDS